MKDNATHLKPFSLFQQKYVVDALCPPQEDYMKVLQLLNENMDRGLAADTHEGAQVPMYCTYVRDVPNGTGAYLLYTNRRT